MKEYPFADVSVEREAELKKWWDPVHQDISTKPDYMGNPMFRNHTHRMTYDLFAMLKVDRDKYELLTKAHAQLEGLYRQLIADLKWYEKLERAARSVDAHPDDFRCRNELMDALKK